MQNPFLWLVARGRLLHKVYAIIIPFRAVSNGVLGHLISIAQSDDNEVGLITRFGQKTESTSVCSFSRAAVHSQLPKFWKGQALSFSHGLWSYGGGSGRPELRPGVSRLLVLFVSALLWSFSPSHSTELQSSFFLYTVAYRWLMPKGFGLTSCLRSCALAERSAM